MIFPRKDRLDMTEMPHLVDNPFPSPHATVFLKHDNVLGSRSYGLNVT
jgi:hypothetical protein